MNDMSPDIMIGAEVIARFLNMRRRQVYRAAEFGYLPVFRVGALICARRSTLMAWIEKQESATASTQTALMGSQASNQLET